MGKSEIKPQHYTIKAPQALVHLTGRQMTLSGRVSITSCPRNGNEMQTLAAQYVRLYLDHRHKLEQVEALGDVDMRIMQTRLRTDHITFWPKRKDAVCTGGVVIVHRGCTFKGKKAVLREGRYMTLQGGRPSVVVTSMQGHPQPA